MRPQIRRNRDILNILSVLGSAVLCAVLVSFFFIYYYGPSGRYIASQTLLDPAILEEINYQDKDFGKKHSTSFVFDHIDFSFFDLMKNQPRQRPVSLEIYQKFYRLITVEESLNEVTESVRDLFHRSRPTLLTIYMRPSETTSFPETKVLQIVQFIAEDYFRVQLIGRQDQGEWAYFYQPGLYQEGLKLFTQ